MDKNDLSFLGVQKRIILEKRTEIVENFELQSFHYQVAFINIIVCADSSKLLASVYW